MATTAQGAALTEAHRVAQARRAAAIAMLTQRLWVSLVDEENIIESAGRWITTLLPRVVRANEQSATLARAYLSTMRTLELDRLEPYTPEPVRLVPEEAVRTSLWVTGPKALEKKLVKISGLDLPPAMERALVTEAIDEAGAQAGGSMLRHTLDGGREQIKDAVRGDRTALGWLRVTKSGPCYFCAMLASRGPVYTDESFEESNKLFSGDGVAKAHDNCACSLQPIYSRKDEGYAQSKEWENLWSSSTTGKTGAAAILAFRQAYEGRVPEE